MCTTQSAARALVSDSASSAPRAMAFFMGSPLYVV
jgi:hypothetical protein